MTSMDAGLTDRLEAIEEIPTLPAVALQVNILLEDHDVAIKALTELIGKDPAIVTKLMRLVNSPFYGFPAKIDTIARAVVVLGFDTVRNAVLAVSVMDAFHTVPGINLREFWQHAIAVAVTSKHLALLSGAAAPDRAFLAGLLHDVGKIILIRFFPELFTPIWEEMQQGGLTFFQTEKHHQVPPHGAIGGYLTHKWHFPPSIVEAISCHHEPRRATEDFPLSCVVHTGNILTHAHMEKGSRWKRLHTDSEASRLLREQLAQTDEWLPGLRSELDATHKFFFPTEKP